MSHKTTHVRIPDNETPFLLGTKQKFFQAGAITLVTEVRDFGEHRYIHYGVAFCNKQDQFIKKVGHNYASAHLLEDGKFSGKVEIPVHTTHKDLVFRCLSDIHAKNQYPLVHC